MDDADGIDVSLIRWFLSLTPAERLAAVQEHLDDLEEIRKLNHWTPSIGILQDANSSPRKATWFQKDINC